MPFQVVEEFLQVRVIKVSSLDFSQEWLCGAVHAQVLAEACKVIDGLALPKHSKCGVVGELFANDIGEDVVELVMFLSREDVP